MSTKRTIGQGLYQDAHGITVLARAGTRPHLREASARFPLVDRDGIPYSKKHCSELIKCRLQLLEGLRRTAATDGTSAGSLGAAIDAFLVAHPVTPGDASRKHEDYHFLLAHWRRSPLALELVATITRKQIREQLEQWTAAGRPPSTVNHRRRAIAAVLRVELAGDDDVDVILPTDKVPYVRPREYEPRGIEIPIVQRILAELPDRGRAAAGETVPPVSLTKIRLTVMVWIGMAHKSLVRLERRRVKFAEGKLFLPARKKGKGSAGLWVDLLPQAVDALRAYDAAGLWGQAFSRSSMWKSWNRAVRNTRRALEREAAESGDRTMLEQFDASVPDHCRPYDLRHSFATEVVRRSGDVHAAKALLQHQDIKTTERYIKAAVPERVAAAIAKMRAHWAPDAPPKGAVVREFQVVQKSGA